MASMTSASFFCIPEETMNNDQRNIYSGICIASAFLASGAAIAQIYQWKPLLRNYLLRRRPTPNPMIVTSLAWANLMICLAVISRAIMILTTSPPTQHIIFPFANESRLATVIDDIPYIPLGGNKPLIGISMVIEILNQYLFGVGFMWTVIYAIDIYMQLLYRETPDILFRILAWTTPVLPCVGVLISLLIGSGNIYDQCPTGNRLLLRHLVYYSLMMLALVVDPVMYAFCRRRINKRIRESGLLNSHNRSIMTALNRKFLAVIVVFFACWIANVVDCIIEIISVSCDVPAVSMARFYPLWLIQAFMNPIQGLLNFFVYGRHMLFITVGNREVRITGSDEKDNEKAPILYDWNAYSSQKEEDIARSAL